MTLCRRSYGHFRHDAAAAPGFRGESLPVPGSLVLIRDGHVRQTLPLAGAFRFSDA